MIGKVPRGKLRFEVSVVKHCNLNCKMCDHFAPIADEEYMDVNQYEMDIKRLSQLFDKKAEYIYLLGGEPLLHPEIGDICKLTRDYFQDCNVVLYTNGILLLKQSSEFWELLKQNRITIIITKYPAYIDYTKAETIMKEYEVEFSYCNINPIKDMNYYPIDLKGKQDANESYIHCSQANNCITLNDGRIYPCSIIPNIKHLNKYFSLNLPVGEENSINIYDQVSPRELLAFVSNPAPFCKYCAVNKREKGIPWETSRKEISEWIL